MLVFNECMEGRRYGKGRVSLLSAVSCAARGVVDFVSVLFTMLGLLGAVTGGVVGDFEKSRNPCGRVLPYESVG